MSFRVQLPLDRVQEFGRVASDGQMGCLQKLYRDWQLSGDDEWLRALWPGAKGLVEEGPQCIAAIPDRYDGRKRNPFDEAECEPVFRNGHHYARAMASWAAVLAWTGFQWSGVTRTMRFAAREGRWFWSNGSAWETCEQRRTGDGVQVTLCVLHGALALRRLEIISVGRVMLDAATVIRVGESLSWQL